MAFSRESLWITFGIKKTIEIESLSLEAQAHGHQKELEGLH